MNKTGIVTCPKIQKIGFSKQLILDLSMSTFYEFSYTRTTKFLYYNVWTGRHLIFVIATSSASLGPFCLIIYYCYLISCLETMDTESLRV